MNPSRLWQWTARAALVGVAASSSACGSSHSSALPPRTTSSVAPTPSSVARSGTSSSTQTTRPVQLEPSQPGDIPDNQVYVVYSTSTYHIKVPEGWARTSDAKGALFTDKYNSVQVQVLAAKTRPTLQSVASSDVPRLAKLPAYHAGGTTIVRRKAGSVILVKYQAASAPNPVTGKATLLDVERYEFWSAGKLAVVTLSGSVGSDNVDPWRVVTDSFAWT